MPTRITFFEVPPEADETFLAAWARDGDGELWRALRADVAYRFVALAAAEEGPDLYEVVHESGRNDVAGGVLLVQAVDDPNAWAAEDLTGHRGHLGRRLYRSYKELRPVLDGLGIAILSTSRGVMSDRQARAQRLGGELLCTVW